MQLVDYGDFVSKNEKRTIIYRPPGWATFKISEKYIIEGRYTANGEWNFYELRGDQN